MLNAAGRPEGVSQAAKNINQPHQCTGSNGTHKALLGTARALQWPKKKHLQAYLRGSKSIQPLSGQGFFPLFVSALIPLLMTKSSLISRELGKTEQKKN